MVFSLSRALAAGALLAGIVNAGDHFILSQVSTLSLTRIDPLMNPGGIGPHAHVVMGASNFSPDSGTPEKLAQAKCSSTMVGADKSSYWTPQVYYNHGNGSYSAVVTTTRIYYFLKALNGTTPVKPFPKGFRVIAGGRSDSRPQTYPPRGQLSYDQQQAMDPHINAIRWGCSAGAVQGQGNGGSLEGQRPYIPNDAPNGCGVLNAGIFFPSCSDGRLDSDDHYSHMKYPLDGPNGYNCPPSHSIKYPTIFLENFYFMNEHQQYRGANTDNWVLSNGDTLGLTFHADFLNGWDGDTLERTLQQCNAPNAPEMDLQKCGPLAETLSVENAFKCRSEGLIADEEVGLVAPINALPGCNPIWPAEARTKPACTMEHEVAAVEPVSRYEVPEHKLSLPLANGARAKIIDASTASTSTTSSAPTSTPAAAQTESEGQTGSTTATSSYSYDPNQYGAPGPSATASDPYGYDASATATSATTQTAAGSAETGSAPSATSSSYEYGVPAAASEPATTSTLASAGQPSSGNPDSEPAAGQPGSQPAPTPAAVQNNASQSTTVAATSTPVPQPQSANTTPSGPGNSKPKTCRRKKAKRAPKSHARRHREWQNRIIH